MLENGKETCSCRWKNCKRHGNCAECIAHHKKSEKYPLPSCKKIRQPRKPKAPPREKA